MPGCILLLVASLLLRNTSWPIILLAKDHQQQFLVRIPRSSLPRLLSLSHTQTKLASHTSTDASHDTTDNTHGTLHNDVLGVTRSHWTAMENNGTGSIKAPRSYVLWLVPRLPSCDGGGHTLRIVSAVALPTAQPTRYLLLLLRAGY